MRLNRRVALCIVPVLLGGCAAGGGIDTEKALVLGAGALQASMLDTATVSDAAALSARELDNQSQIAAPGTPYALRLASLTGNLQNFDGLKLNYKVYLSKEVNAFAMADGTVRVYSGLLDLMPDDQVLAVMFHEIGHVRLQHSYRQMKQVLLTNVAFEAVASVGGTIGQLTASELGTIGRAAVNARFSQADELEADAYAVRTLKQLNRDPYAMQRSIETLEQRYGDGGGFLSSHPSNSKRLEAIRKEIGR